MDIDVRDLSPVGCVVLLATAVVSLVGGVAFFAWLGALFPNAGALSTLLPYLWVPVGLAFFWGTWKVLESRGLRLLRPLQVSRYHVERHDLELFLYCIANSVDRLGHNEVQKLVAETDGIREGEEVVRIFKAQFDTRVMRIRLSIAVSGTNALEVTVAAPELLGPAIDKQWDLSVAEQQ